MDFDQETNAKEASSTCLNRYDANLYVPNSRSELLYVSDFAGGKQAYSTISDLTNTSPIIGATVTSLTRYIIYILYHTPLERTLSN